LVGVNGVDVDVRLHAIYEYEGFARGTEVRAMRTAVRTSTRRWCGTIAFACVAKSFHDFLLEFAFRDVKLEYFLGRKHL
jgi:hypothetical protein